MSAELEDGELVGDVIWRNGEALGEVPWQFKLRAHATGAGWQLEAVCTAAEVVILLNWPAGWDEAPQRIHSDYLIKKGFEIV